MIACGIEITAKRAVFVFLESKGSVKDVTGRCTQVKIDDDDDPDALKRFQRTVFEIFADRCPDRIGILQRKKFGNFAASGTTFKLEALIQLYPEHDVTIVSGHDLRAFVKGQKPEVTPRYQYQKNAYLLSLFLIEGGAP